jgi:hypothetical protein
VGLVVFSEGTHGQEEVMAHNVLLALGSKEVCTSTSFDQAQVTGAHAYRRTRAHTQMHAPRHARRRTHADAGAQAHVRPPRVHYVRRRMPTPSHERVGARARPHTKAHAHPRTRIA